MGSALTRVLETWVLGWLYWGVAGAALPLNLRFLVSEMGVTGLSRGCCEVQMR